MNAKYRLVRNFTLSVIFVCLTAATVWAARVASLGSPQFSVEVPNGWKAEPKTNGENQQILLQSSTRTLMIIAAQATNGEASKAEASALDWIKKNKFANATVIQASKATTFGSHSGHEMVVKDKNNGVDYCAWLATFADGKVVFICIGISTPDDQASAAADYHAVVSTVTSGAATASTGNGNPPQVSKPSWKQKLKNVARAFLHILMKVPVFNPNKGS